MSHADRSYYEARAEAELQLAQRSDHPAVVRAHYNLAALYLDLVHGTAPADERMAAWDKAASAGAYSGASSASVAPQ